MLYTYTQVPGDSLTARIRRRHGGTGHDSWRAMLHRILSSNVPLSTALAMGRVQAVLLFIGTASLFMMLPGVADIMVEAVPRARCAAVRFTVLSLRNGTAPRSAAGGAGEHGTFGVLSNGCEVPGIASAYLMEDVNDSENGPVSGGRRLRQYLTAPAGAMLEFNGISFVTAAQATPDADPASFVVECAGDNEQDFEPVAASGNCAWFPTSWEFLRSSVARERLPRARMPLARSEMAKWDYTATKCMQVRQGAAHEKSRPVGGVRAKFYPAQVRVWDDSLGMFGTAGSLCTCGSSAPWCLHWRWC